ncbi:hypothetical protein PRUB_a4597 [Pseudoalteromonas rubra]|uniref:Uncharacterized protein n=1 Tax=Pseudoalteromonas rubra TaxID=43658 RepID=A0A8T0C9L0_9GAMM|nr:hypothetical protein PRUB_a4597 [Pseudoalteromonas rubra]
MHEIAVKIFLRDFRFFGFFSWFLGFDMHYFELNMHFQLLLNHLVALER